MTQIIDNGWSSSVLLRRIGYCLLLLALFDAIHILVPPRFMNPEWEFQVIGALVERVPVPLLGLGLVFYGEEDFRSKWERLPLKFLSWACLLIGILFLLLAPLILVERSRLDNQITYQINTQVIQQLSQFEQLEKQLGKATTAKDIYGVVARFRIEGLPPNIKVPQKLKSQVLSQTAKAKETIRTKTEATWAGRRLAMLKKSVKWFLGSLVSGILLVYTWQMTRWARQVRKWRSR